MMIWSRQKEANNDNQEDFPRVKLSLIGQVNFKLDKIVLNQDLVTFNPVVFGNRSWGIAKITLCFQVL
jgi:hypothetical protein